MDQRRECRRCCEDAKGSHLMLACCAKCGRGVHSPGELCWTSAGWVCDACAAKPADDEASPAVVALLLLAAGACLGFAAAAAVLEASL